MKNLNKMNEREIDMGVAGTSKSWHNQVDIFLSKRLNYFGFFKNIFHQYKDSAWIFAGGLPYELTEGDVICVFSQYGEIVHINLIRDQKSGKSKGFGFICYEDQRSTILAVDNLNGMKLCGRLVRVDHVHTYKLPKDLEKMDADRKKLFLEGCAPKAIEPVEVKEESEEELLDYQRESKKKKKKKEKKKKKSKKKKKKHKKASSSESSSESDDDSDSSEEDENLKSRSRDEKRTKGHKRSPSCSPGRSNHRKGSYSREERNDDYSRKRQRSVSRERSRRRSRSVSRERRKRSRSREYDRHQNKPRGRDGYRR